MNILSYSFLALLIASISLQWWLARRQTRFVTMHRDNVPEAFRDKIDLPTHQKAADYTCAKISIGHLETFVSAILLLGWTLGGGLNALDRIWTSFGWGPVITGIVFLLSFAFISALLTLPFDLYRTFVLEERFGFNRSTLKLFITDLIKQTLIGLIIGTPLIAAALWFMNASGKLWWIYVWLLWVGFSVLMLWLYPTFIAPLFNKFEPLAQDSTRTRIEELLRRTGFKSQGVFVMDGSKRSGHGNAYFTGFGNAKRIVFFDTLLKHLNDDEIEAVLAHELGHFKRHHVRKRIALTFAMSFAGLALLGWLSGQNWFYHGLGMDLTSAHAALILFMLAIPVFTFFLQPLFSALSRRHEYEADDFAAQQTRAQFLIDALVKLYQENASTLTPDPLHSLFYDSHPPAALRIAHLQTKPAYN